MPPPPSASASRPSRTPRCPQIVSLGGANHRPWMRRGRRHQCAHATLHGLALRRGFSARNRTGHHRVRSRGMRFLSPREIPDSRGFGQPRLPTLVCSRPPVPRSPRDAAKSAAPWLARRRCVTTPSLPTTHTLSRNSQERAHVCAQGELSRRALRGRCSACSLRFPHPRRRACTCAAASS